MSSDAPQFPEQSPQAAAASAAQSDLLGTQTALLKNQLGLQNLLAPVLYQQLGLTPTKDENGQITGFTQSQDAAKTTQLLQENQRATLGRELDAIQGKLPIDPQLTQELDRQEAQLHSSLQRSLGPDYATSTPGQQALQDFQQRRANIVESAAQGQITSAAQLASAATGSAVANNNSVDSQIATALGISQAPLTGISMFSPIVQGNQGIVSADNNVRSQKYQGAVQAQGDFFGGIGSLIGTAAGIALAPATGGASLALTVGGGLKSLFGGGGGGGIGSTQAGYSPTFGFGP